MLSETKQNRDRGISKSIRNADEKIENWSTMAFNFLRFYCSKNNEFMTEQVREASIGSVPEPPSARAWGGIIVRAVKSGMIQRKCYKQVSNPKANSATASLWDVIR